jgi:nucleotide-binding universal stress UspA family protein
MLNVRSILFPTDGSACAEYAHAHAHFLADQFDAELHVVHVVEDQINTLANLSELVDIDEADILEQLRLPLPEAVTEPADGRVHRETLTHSSAAEGVLAYATEHDVDLIVMGTHGRRGMGRMLMGSVAEEIVRLGNCPTLTVCGKRQPEPNRDVNRILVPMGLSEHTAALFDHATAIAATYDAHLDLIHVVEQSALPSVYEVDAAVDESAVEERVQNALNAYVQKAMSDGVEATGTVHRGHPAAVILDRVDHEPIDLVAIATHGRTGLKRLLMGSVAEKVVRMASCPVFTVKSFGKSLVTSRDRTEPAST